MATVADLNLSHKITEAHLNLFKIMVLDNQGSTVSSSNFTYIHTYYIQIGGVLVQIKSANATQLYKRLEFKLRSYRLSL